MVRRWKVLEIWNWLLLDAIRPSNNHRDTYYENAHIRVKSLHDDVISTINEILSNWIQALQHRWKKCVDWNVEK